MKYAAGVDVGGTNVVCGLIEETGRVVARHKYATAPENGSAAVLEGIGAAIERLREEAGIAADDLEAIGLGIPGLSDPERGVSVRAVNLHWSQVPVAAEMRRRLGKPAYIDNDVRMYAYGEALAGAGRGARYVLGVTIGTGLASAFVQNGELLYGHRCMAGEIGHVPIEHFESIPCNCGRTGCLETVVSATGIARQARTRIERGERSSLAERFPDLSRLRSVDVTEACLAGDALAKDVLDRTGRALGAALAWAVPLLSPDAIVIGGGGALAGDALFVPMKQELESRLLQDYKDQFAIKSAELHDDAGLIGSALWALARNRKALHT
ncbi:ROK family protein [Paenibacillus sp.]|uniref:ROK family protein n=1 Tax=Paenibacillus sp. TaxID=58172 RepID=UPI002811DC80|nr:ROK family protein [Paenibacillus sp.]